MIPNFVIMEKSWHSMLQAGKVQRLNCASEFGMAGRARFTCYCDATESSLDDR